MCSACLGAFRFLAGWLVLGVLGAVLGGCSAVQIVPVQMSRVPIIETYQQRFHFSEAKGLSADAYPLDRQRRINAQINSHFRRLVGPKNWETLKEHYGLGPLRDELLEGKLHIKGHVSATISLHPQNYDQFVFGGIGRFFLMRESPSGGELLMSGDFVLEPQTHWISELERGWVDAPVSLFISRIPGEITRKHNANVQYRIFIDNAAAEHQVYSIDYDRRHEVYLLGRNRNTIDEDTALIGHLTFDRSDDGSQVIDLRGMQFLRRDYHKLRRSAKPEKP